MGRKCIQDYPQTRDCTVWALRDTRSGSICGKLIAAHAQSECRVALHIYGDPIERFREREDMPGPFLFNMAVIGRASGYGYHKLSAAFEDCLRKNGCVTDGSIGGAGEGAMIDWFNEREIDVYPLL